MRLTEFFMIDFLLVYLHMRTGTPFEDTHRGVETANGVRLVAAEHERVGQISFSARVAHNTACRLGMIRASTAIGWCAWAVVTVEVTAYFILLASSS